MDLLQYKQTYGVKHSFLAKRLGIKPNTLHAYLAKIRKFPAEKAALAEEYFPGVKAADIRPDVFGKYERSQ